MLLNEITLRNFRQFKGEHHIKFSVDPQKNVNSYYGRRIVGVKQTLARCFCTAKQTFKTSSVF